MADINDRITAPPAEKLELLGDRLRSLRPQASSASARSVAAGSGERGQTRLSFIIPWSKRPELYIGLKKNLEILANDHTEVIVVTTEADVPNLKRETANIDIPGLRIVEVCEAEFNKCAFLNLGAYSSCAGTLFLLDCDTLVDCQTLEAARAALAKDTFVIIREGIEMDHVAHRELMVGLACVQEKLETTELLFANGSRASFEYFQSTTGRSLVGLTMLSKADYLAVEGLNSDLEGWGAEDYDFQIRLQVKAGLRRVSVGKATHLTHPSSSYGAGALSHYRNIETIFGNYNKHDFLGTYSRDVSRWSSRLRLCDRF